MLSSTRDASPTYCRSAAYQRGRAAVRGAIFHVRCCIRLRNAGPRWTSLSLDRMGSGTTPGALEPRAADGAPRHHHVRELARLAVVAARGGDLGPRQLLLRRHLPRRPERRHVQLARARRRAGRVGDHPELESAHRRVVRPAHHRRGHRLDRAHRRLRPRLQGLAGVPAAPPPACDAACSCLVRHDTGMSCCNAFQAEEPRRRPRYRVTC
jgi:hypothetical protein